MENNPSWEDNRASGSQEIPSILCNPEILSRTDSLPPSLSILSHSNEGNAPPSNFLNIHFNIILSFMARSSKCSLSMRSAHQNPVRTFPVPNTCHSNRPSHSFWFDHPKNNWWGVQSIKLIVMYSSPIPCFPVPLRCHNVVSHFLLLGKCKPQYSRKKILTLFLLLWTTWGLERKTWTPNFRTHDDTENNWNKLGWLPCLCFI